TNHQFLVDPAHATKIVMPEEIACLPVVRDQRRRYSDTRDDCLAECDPRDALWLVRCHRVANPHAAIMTNHRKPFVAERRHEPEEVASQRSLVVAILWLVRDAEPARVGYDESEMCCQG